MNRFSIDLCATDDGICMFVCVYSIFYMYAKCVCFFIQMVINMIDKADESAQIREKKQYNGKTFQKCIHI